MVILEGFNKNLTANHKSRKERIESILSQISKGNNPNELSGLTTADFLAMFQEIVSKNIQIDKLEKDLVLVNEKNVQFQSDRTDFQDSITELIETQRISEAIQSSRDPESVILVLMTFLKDLIDPKAFGFQVNVEDLFSETAVDMYKSEKISKILNKLKEDGIIDWALSEANPVIIPDMDNSSENKDNSIVIIPLVTSNVAIGTVVLSLERPTNYFNANDIRVLSILANHAAIAIDNIRLNLETERTKVFLEGLIGSSPLPIFVTSDKDKIMFANPSAGDFLGISLDDFQGINISNIFEGGISSVNEIRSTIKSEGRVVGIRVNLVNTDGKVYPVSLTATELVSNDIKSNKFLWLCESLEEKDALEDERIKSEKLRVLYNTVVSLNHEINNPLTVMNGNLMLLESLLSTKDEKTLKILGAAVRASKRIEDVTNKLTNIDKIEFSQYDNGVEMLNLD